VLHKYSSEIHSYLDKHRNLRNKDLFDDLKWMKRVSKEWIKVKIQLFL